MGQLSGKSGFVKLGATTYAFGKWDADIQAGAPDVTNWGSGGFADNVEGVKKAGITCSGPQDVGGMPLAAGTVYEFHLGLDTGVELVIPARVTNIRPTNDVNDAPRVSITATSKGVFTAAIT